MEYTAANEFMSELADINDFILHVLDSPIKAAWHWPSFYLFYVDVDRLSSLLGRVRYVFESPFPAFGEPVKTEERVTDDNALFALLDKQQQALVDWLFQMYRRTATNPVAPAAHKRVGAHVHPKSGWYQVFMREYRFGVLTADGNCIQRVALPVHPSTEADRIDDITASCMLRHQCFDVSTPAARAALARATEEALSRLEKVQAAMTAYLSANCTIANLLHPCSH